jgi:hypothetical protein
MAEEFTSRADLIEVIRASSMVTLLLIFRLLSRMEKNQQAGTLPIFSSGALLLHGLAVRELPRPTCDGRVLHAAEGAVRVPRGPCGGL